MQPLDADDPKFAEAKTRNPESFAVTQDATGLDLPSRIPARIGRYQIKTVIASGGMGTVYLAEQESPRRSVALKVLKHGFFTPSALKRFGLESEVLARLHHPNVAQVYESGTYDDGSGAVPFFVMEHVADAATLLEYVRAQSLDMHQRLRLFVQICDAVHHGHQKGIIHRDLKPGNILVEPDGTPKIIDFGVAKVTDADIAVTTIETLEGQLVGTIPYMSPEQCSARANDIDVRSDVYSLGVVLYQLLADRLPHDLVGAAIHQAVRMIQEDPPTRLSSINRTLRGDVEAIALKALEKDKERRYQSAVELARDVERFLDHKPIDAQFPSAMYRLRKMIRRHRGAVIALATIFLLLTGGVIGTSIGLIQSSRSNVALGEAVDLADERADRAERRLYVAGLMAGTLATDNHDIPAARDNLNECPETRRNFEWKHAERRISDDILRVGEAKTSAGDSPRSIEVHPSGTHAFVITSGRSGTFLQRLDLESGELTEIRDVPGTTLAYSAEANSIAIGDRDGFIQILDEHDGTAVHTLTGHGSDSVSALDFSPDGKFLASGAHGRMGSRVLGQVVHIWNVASGESVHQVELDSTWSVRSLAFSPDGRLLAVSTWTGFIYFVEVESGTIIRHIRPSEDIVDSIDFSPDGALLASTLRPNRIQIHQVSDLSLSSEFETEVDVVSQLRFGPDGKTVAVNSRVGFDIHDAATGVLLKRLTGHEWSISEMEFVHANSLLVSAGADSTLRVWDPRMPDETTIVRKGTAGRIGGDTPAYYALDISPNNTLAAFAYRNEIELRNLITDREIGLLRGHSGAVVTSLSFSPDGHTLASAGMEGVVLLWDALTARPRTALVGHDGSVQTIAFSPDGTTIATGSMDRTIRLWGVATGRGLGVLRGHEDLVYSLVFSPDGTRLYSGSRDTDIRIWDVEPMEQIGIIDQHTGTVGSLAVTPDGQYLISGAGSGDNTVREWDLATLSPTRTLFRGEYNVFCLALSSDATRLAIGTGFRRTYILDVESGDEVAFFLDSEGGSINGVDFSDDGRYFVSCGFDGSFVVRRKEDASAQSRQYRAFLDAMDAAPAILARLESEDSASSDDPLASRALTDDRLSDVERQAALETLMVRNIESQESLDGLLLDARRRLVRDERDSVSPVHLNELAWMLLTTPDETLRDPLEALEYATLACTRDGAEGGSNLWMFLDTLALALFETGDSTSAIANQSRALDALPSDVNPQARQQMERQLELYKSGVDDDS